ncbi:MAG: hypothetical protein ACRC57_11595 [Sarcina sp.]
MKLVKGKVKFIRSMLGCIIFPLLFCFFYSFVQSGSNWFEVNQWLGIALGIAFLVRAIFEQKIAKNKNNTKMSYFGTIVVFLYVILRFFNIV